MFGFLIRFEFADDLEQRDGELSAARDERDRFINTSLALQAQLNQALINRSALSTQLSEANACVDELRRTCAELTTRSEDAEAALEHEKQQIAELQMRLASEQQAMIDLKCEMTIQEEKHQAHVKTLSEQLEHEKGVVAELKENLSQTTQELLTTRQSLTQTESDYASHQQTAQQTQDDLQQQVQQHQSTIGELNDELANLQRESEKSAMEHQLEVGGLVVELTRAHQQLDDSSADVFHQRDQLTLEQAHGDRLQAEVDSLAARLEVSQSQCQQMHSKIEQVGHLIPNFLI
jgi:chromosome segregation ATPase